MLPYPRKNIFSKYMPSLYLPPFLLRSEPRCVAKRGGGNRPEKKNKNLPQSPLFRGFSQFPQTRLASILISTLKYRRPSGRPMTSEPGGSNGKTPGGIMGWHGETGGPYREEIHVSRGQKKWCQVVSWTSKRFFHRSCCCHLNLLRSFLYLYLQRNPVAVDIGNFSWVTRF